MAQKFEAHSALTRESGYTLSELAVATGIGSFLLIAIFTFLTTTVTHVTQMSLTGARTAVQSQIARVLSDDKYALQMTRNKNSTFDNCFKPNPNTSDCLGETIFGISLYDADGTQLTGTPDQPVYYDQNGAKCPDQNSKCPLMAFSVARAQGVPDWQAGTLQTTPGWWGYFEFVEVRYAIVPNPSTLMAQNLRPVSGSVTFDTEDVEDWIPQENYK